MREGVFCNETAKYQVDFILSWSLKTCFNSYSYISAPTKSKWKTNKKMWEKQKTVESIAPAHHTNACRDTEKSRPHLSYVHTGIKAQTKMLLICPEAYISSLLMTALAFIAIQYLWTDTWTATCSVQPFPRTLLAAPPWLQKGCAVKEHTKSPLQQDNNWTKI